LFDHLRSKNDHVRERNCGIVKISLQ